jgi:type I restriction enzyme S subunit
MSKLDELIKEYCPDGVPFLSLGDIGRFYGGLNGKSKEDFKDGNATFITYMNVYSNLAIDLQVDDKVKVGADEKQNVIEYGDVIFTGSSETPNECGMSSVLTSRTDLKLYLNSFCFGYRFNDPQMFLPDFTKHLFRSIELRKQISRTASGVTRFNVSKKKMERVIVPVPPLEVQREIARILDEFTLLSAELSAELSARKKQYEFYRNKMLTFETRIEKIPMGDLFDFRNGLSKGKEYFGKGIPFIRYTDVYNHRALRKEDITALVECTDKEKESLKVSRGDVMFTRTSETAEDVGWSSVMLDNIGDCVFNGFTIKATPKTDKLLPEYCAYCFSTDDFRKYVTSRCAFTTRASLTGNTIAEYKLSVPPIEVQKKIANVLDNFESICNDLNIGLPAEIDARQKQYEYYRDTLLTFVEKGETILTEQNRTEQNRTEQNRTEQNRT